MSIDLWTLPSSERRIFVRSHQGNVKSNRVWNIDQVSIPGSFQRVIYAQTVGEEPRHFYCRFTTKLKEPHLNMFMCKQKLAMVHQQTLRNPVQVLPSATIMVQPEDSCHFVFWPVAPPSTRLPITVSSIWVSVAVPVTFQLQRFHIIKWRWWT